MTDLRRVDDSTWPALRSALATRRQAGHPVLDRELFDWMYRGYGAAADGAPWGFVAVEDGDVVAFVGLIPGMVRHVKHGGACAVRPQALVAGWFVAPEHRGQDTAMLLLEVAERSVAVLGGLGVDPQATATYRRLGYPRMEDLARWVVPLGPGYARLLADPAGAAAVTAWREQVPEAAAAVQAPLDAGELAALAREDEVLHLSGLHRCAEFYAWRYEQSAGFRYVVVGVRDGGRAIVRVETALLDGADPVLRIIELLPGAGAAPALVSGVLAWGRAHGCCAADFQISAGDPLEPALTSAGLRRAAPGEPETTLAEVLRPYRPRAARTGVVFRPDADDLPHWRFLKSDGGGDGSDEPYAA
jgi:GNAT superfamily N-acetyltransferase